MFLSLAQIELINRLAHEEQRLDILDCNVNTVSALSVRGLTQVNYADKAGDITNVTLTDTGFAIAGRLSFYVNPPKYYDVVYKNSRAKQKHKKWAEKHAKKVA